VSHNGIKGKGVVSTNDNYVVISSKIAVVFDYNNVVNFSIQKIIVFNDAISLFFRADMLSIA